jgi:hypothetical protein
MRKGLGPHPTHGESKRKFFVRLGPPQVISDERSQTFRTEIKPVTSTKNKYRSALSPLHPTSTPRPKRDANRHSQLLPILLLLLLGQSILGLSDLKLALSLQSDETHSEVGTTEIDSEVFSLFLTLGVLWAGNIQRS